MSSTPTSIAGATALVTGASRGFGRDIATSLSKAGAQVVGVARDKDQLSQLGEELGGSFTGVTADAAAPETAWPAHRRLPAAILVLNAGAAPLSRPLHQHTWQTFSRNWDVDVQHAFRWVREALLRPLDPGSCVDHGVQRRRPARVTAVRRLRRRQGRRSGSSRRTRRTSRSGRVSASGSAACCRS